MIYLNVIRRILLSLAPLAVFYLLKRVTGAQSPRKKVRQSDFDKNNVVEGEIVNEKY